LNQEQVKNILIQLENNVEEYKVIFSGKTSKKVNGLYYPDKKEIIIHNKNFTDDNSLVYTAIHEFTHHVHISRSPIPISNRCHTNEFWNIFHKLLFKAEELGLYKNIFETNEEFNKLTNEIKNSFLFKNAELMKNTGKLLITAINLCQKHKVRFEDYVDRGLLLNRTTANTMVKLYTMDINPEIGFDNMKIASKIKDNEERKKIENEFLSGKTQDMIKAEISSKNKPTETIDILEAEKNRLEKTIDTLNQKLEAINEKINELAVSG
jgi:hypothetical protein